MLQKHSRKTLLPGGAQYRFAGRYDPVVHEVDGGCSALAHAAGDLAQSAADISADHTFSTGFKFAEQSGESLYKSVCQACHMPNGEGAIGAGSYPSLANDPALGNYGYPVYVVVFGKRAMPSFGDMMSNDQVAAW